MKTVVEYVSKKNNLRKLKFQAMKFVRDEEKADDLVQETVFKMLKNKERFREESNIDGWAFIILKNTFISQYRKIDQRLTPFPEDFREGENGMTFDLVDYNEETSIQDIEIIENLVENLPFSLKVTLKLVTLGYQYDDIADILEIPMGTVKNRIHIARKLLKEELDKLNV